MYSSSLAQQKYRSYAFWKIAICNSFSQAYCTLNAYRANGNLEKNGAEGFKFSAFRSGVSRSGLGDEFGR